MKILTTEQIRAADQHTINSQSIKSIDLMEQASLSFVEAFVQIHMEQLSITVVCGPGNNGGDGLAIARLLSEKNFEVEVWLIKIGSDLSPDCVVNLNRWQELGNTIEITSIEQLDGLSPGNIVVDAIFGSGINRGVTGLPAGVIQLINQSNSLVVAVDMPSGLFANSANPSGEIVEADYTISFQAAKLAFFLPQNNIYVGDWQIVDIGLDQKFISGLESNWFQVDQPLIRSYGRKQNKFAHKGNHGHALLVSGSKGKMGAAILAAKAALRAGLGLLTVHIPRCGYLAVQTAVPEAMCELDPAQEVCTEIIWSEKYQALAIGPGLGQSTETERAVQKLMEQVKCPLVVDADGLNILSKRVDLLKLLPSNSILTPHPGEFQRLVGEVNDDYHRLELQQEFAKKYQIILICKGAYTTIATADGRLFFNTTGNPGMATAGSGDVLTGIITGLLTRTKDPMQAAIVGVFLHGVAGDLAADEQSSVAMIAGDIVDHIGHAIKMLNLQL